VRCKACDAQFTPNWNEEHGEFEDLCEVCLPVALDAAEGMNYTESESNYRIPAKRILPDE